MVPFHQVDIALSRLMGMFGPHGIGRRNTHLVRETSAGHAFVSDLRYHNINGGLSKSDYSHLQANPNARFRQNILNLYDNRCAVCGFSLSVNDSVVALDAAHILWHSHNGPAIPENGLCLCSIHHRVFDIGGFTLLPRGNDLLVIVSSVISGPSSYETLNQYHAKPISILLPEGTKPATSYIQWHNTEVFRTPWQISLP